MSQTERALAPGTPRWVKALGIITLVFVVLLGIILLSGGEHSPNMHLPPASTTEIYTPPIEHNGQ